jgi:1-acyl-sn-glycerol-3-phosphate acyltransferase
MALDLRHDGKLYHWRRAIFRWGIWNIAYRFWIRLHIEGWTNIPAESPVLLMSNHIAALDPGVLISFYPGRDIVPIAKMETLDRPAMRYFIRHWGAITIHRGEADLKALKAAIDHLAHGDIVLLFAEGTRSKTGLIEGQEGSAYLALKTDAWVVPVAIWGSRGFPKSWLHEFRRTDIYLRFGQPFKFKHEGGKLPREHFRAMTDEAMYQIARLLPAEWRGAYSDLSLATTQFLDFNLSWTPVSVEPPRVLDQTTLAPA